METITVEGVEVASSLTMFGQRRTPFNPNWKRETAAERRHADFQTRAFLPTMKKPHEGPCFRENKEGQMVQTHACKTYHIAQYEHDLARAVAGKSGKGRERAALSVKRAEYFWQWHPGRGLGAQEIDNLLMQNYPIQSPEARHRSFALLWGRRGKRLMHPDDFANAMRRVDEAEASALQKASIGGAA